MTSPDDWEILEPIGAGAHAVVHRAVRRDRPGRVVALKQLRHADPRAVADLEREAAVLADLAHPAIATLDEVLVGDDGIALVLGLATGGSLADRIEREGRLSWTVVADLGARLAGGLAAAHDAGVIHRDVKPSNVLFGREDEPRLADFGLARLSTEDPDDLVAGTAGYIDPDVVDGAAPGPRADQWSLGVVLWEALVGQPPFAGRDDAAIVRAADRDAHLPLRGLVPEAPDELAGAIERAMARDPAARFPHCRDLEGVLAALAVSPDAAEVPPTGDEDQPADGAESSTARVVGSAGSSRSESDPVAGPVDPTVTWGPRPPRPVDEPIVPADRSRLRLAVAGLVVVPLVVTAWAVARLAAPAGPGTGSTGTGAAPVASSSRSPPSPGPVVSSGPAESARDTDGDDRARPEPRRGGVARALPADWRPRTGPRPCDDQPRSTASGPTWWADVDGRGCAVRIATTDGDADGRLVLEVAGASAVAGLWDLGPATARVVMGDWDGDDADTPALVTADGRLWTFAAWADDAARPAGTIGPGALAVVTDRSGRDHVVSARDLDRTNGGG